MSENLGNLMRFQIQQGAQPGSTQLSNWDQGWNSGVNERLANAQRVLEGMMTNQLGQARLGLDTRQRLGFQNPDGTFTPGELQINRLQAEAIDRNSRNTPRAEDVAADAIAEQRIKELKDTKGITDERQIKEEFARNGWPLPRRLGGVHSSQSQDVTPSYMVGPPMPRPTGTTGGTSSGANPLRPESVPAPTVRPTTPIGDTAVQPPTPETDTQGGGNTPPALTAEQAALEARNRVQAALDSARSLSPLRAPLPAGVAPPSNAAFFPAITQALRGISQEDLQGIHQVVIDRMAQDPAFGGAGALNEWMMQNNNWASNLVPANRAQNTEIDRILAARGLTRRPGYAFDTDAPWWHRINPLAIGASIGESMFPELQRPQSWTQQMLGPTNYFGGHLGNLAAQLIYGSGQ
jgi:hypothetical protein